MVFIINIIIAGFTGIIAQTLLIREMVNVFSGNVFSLGMILAGWLFWAAAGSYVSGRVSPRFTSRTSLYIFNQLLICIMLLLTILLVRDVRPLFHIPPGELIGFSPLLISSWLALAPLAFLVGWQFTLACKITGRMPLVYRYDVSGSLLGAVLFSFILVNFLSTLATVFLTVGINLLGGFFLWYARGEPKNKWLAQALALGLVLVLGLGLSKKIYLLEEMSHDLLWRGFQVLATARSRYAQYTVIKDGDLNNFYVNGVLNWTNPDMVSAEMIAHLAMLETPAPRRVLVLGGGFNGLIGEILKYPVEQIDYVELDETLLRLARGNITERDRRALLDFRVAVHNMDGRLFIRQHQGSKFDVVIINTGSPLTAEANRFYTLEFFQSVKQALSERGVVIMGVDSNENYLSPELRDYNSCLYWTLKQVFPGVILVPGENLYLLGSPSEEYLSMESQVLLDRLARHKVMTNIFAATIPFRLSPERLEFITQALQDYPAQRINRDFTPISYYQDIMLWGKQFQSRWPGLFRRALQWSWWQTAIALAIIGFLWWLAADRIRSAVFPLQVLVTGFAAMSLEMILIIGFQAIVGYIYHILGLIIAIFMLGLVLGAGWSTRKESQPAETRRLILRQLIFFGTLILLVPPLLAVLEHFVLPLLAMMMIFIATAADGFMVGVIFPLTCRLYDRPGLLYAMDLLGACAGTVLISLILIPVLGLNSACLFLGLLVLWQAFIAWRAGKKVAS